MIPSSRSMLSRDKRLPLDTLNLFASQENFFGNPRSMFKPSQTPYPGIIHRSAPSATRAVPLHVCAGTPVARGEKRIGSTIPMPTFVGRHSTLNFLFFFLIVNSKDFYGWTGKTADIGGLVRQNSHTIIIFMWVDELKNLATNCRQ